MKPSDIVKKFGLTCDGPQGCGHRIDIATPDTWKELRAHIGTPCPKCGGDMLTEKSARAGWRMTRGALMLIGIGRALGLCRVYQKDEPTAPGERLWSVTLKTTPEGAQEYRAEDVTASTTKREA